ncbi:AAA family ATPase [Massilia sp. CCM 8734]|uniref:ExeA family protein n=1 Tax=Massilia sp. CCM 8734 TaxID=2609283 RepID=UPI001E4F8295|nr:AAA family ATPase [Massilia sp. CCM 8734]
MRELNKMYHKHFGLHQSPFGITPNPAFFYAGNTRGEILDALLYAVEHGEGIIKVTGEVGSGKTMLCRMLENQLPKHIDVIYLANPTLKNTEVAYAIAGELELDVSGKRIDEVTRMLQADLIARHSAGKQVVLLVEEAQAMPLETLEEVRLFSNLETARHKLLQIVLFGQPELDAHLNLASMRQFKERITHNFVVPAMPPDVIADFLAFRLHAAGYNGPAVFSAAAARHIARVSQGIVRRINILADKALMAAYIDESDRVEARHAKAAIADCAFASPNRAGGKTLAMAVVGMTTLSLLAWLVSRSIFFH